MCNNPSGCDCQGPYTTCQGCYWNQTIKKVKKDD